MLAPEGYDEETRSYVFTGFITKTPLEKGGKEPRRVMLPEIYMLRQLMLKKKDKQGRPVDYTKVVFGEEWMARQERRPLQDNGARVFFLRGGHEVEVTD